MAKEYKAIDEAIKGDAIAGQLDYEDYMRKM